MNDNKSCIFRESNQILDQLLYKILDIYEYQVYLNTTLSKGYKLYWKWILYNDRELKIIILYFYNKYP